MQLHCKDGDIDMNLEDWQEIAQKTELFSGSDISSLILDALFQPIRRLQATKLWTYTEGDITL